MVAALYPTIFSFRWAKKEPEGTYRNVPLVPSLVQKTLSRVQEPAGINLSSKVVTSLSLTDATISSLSNSLQLIPSIGSKHSIVQGLRIASSGLGLLIGSAVTVGNGLADFNKSRQVNDCEGMRCARAEIVAGAFAVNSAALSLTEKIAISISALSSASNVLYVLGSLINMGASIYLTQRCISFLSKIDHSLEAKGLSEKERTIRALQFLKSKIILTPEEQEAIEKGVDQLHPKWGPNEKSREVRRRILDRSEVKVRYFKRRTSLPTAIRVLKEIDHHLNQLKGPNCDEKSLKAAQELIEEVKSQSRKRVLLSAVAIATSTVALIGLVLGTFFSLGTLPFVLYAISSVIALLVLLYPMIVDNLYASKIQAMESQAVAFAPVVVVVSK